MKRIEGETTAVFTAAKRIPQEVVQRSGRPIQFEVETSFLKMKGWLQTTGKMLFGWTIQPTIDDLLRLKAEVEIR